MLLQVLTSRLLQFLLMRQAIAEADQRASSIGATGTAHCRAARLLLGAAESLDDFAERQLGVIVLGRQALISAALGLALRRQAIESDANPKTVWQKVSAFDDVQPVLRRRSAEATEKIDVVLTSGLSAGDVDLSAPELRSLKQTLLQTVRGILELLEDDVFAPKRLRSVRIVRWVGAAIGIALVVAVVVKAFRPSHA